MNDSIDESKTPIDKKGLSELEKNNADFRVSFSFRK